MNASIASFRLIIVHDSPQEAQRLSSMFHNAGKPCRAKHINAEDNLNKILEEQSWDLLITYDNNELLPTNTVIRSVRKFEHDIPIILLTEEDENIDVVRVSGMKLGTCDVAQVDNDQHLLLIVNRELENRRHRKQTRITQRKLKELERRNQNLLDSSRDGIAYIQDGMYLYANSSYTEMLGHESRDDVEFMPLIDHIPEADQRQVKKALRDFALQKDSSDHQDFEFTTVLPDNTHQKIKGELFLGEHEGESCTQLIVQAKVEKNEIIEAELQSIKDKDPLTGLYNRTYLMKEIETALSYSIQNEVSKSLILIDVDRFSKKVKQQLSITDTDELIKKTSHLIAEHFPNEPLIARISDHTFAIISDENDPNQLIENGNGICKTIKNHLFEIGQKTLNFTLSVGVCLINESIPDSQTLIHNVLKAIDTLRKTQDGNGTNIFQKQAEEGSILASNFKKALENDEFKLLFQPILSLRGDETERYEVLLRMTIDDKMLSPPEFLSIAADLNLSKRIDRWVILRSISLLQKNAQEGKNSQHFINITTESLCDDTLLPWMKVAIEAAKIDASTIVFQVKEAAIIQHLTAAKKFYEDAKALGIMLCITNYSGSDVGASSALDYVGAEYIKVDGTLSLEIQESSDIDPLKNIIEDLHSKNKITIIPLIEKASILSNLWQLGVHCIQGNYLHPVSKSMDYQFTSED
jgi:diguanylate cyclase (GGDEF)-like protein